MMGKIQCSRATQGHKPSYTKRYILITNYGEDPMLAFHTRTQALLYSKLYIYPKLWGRCSGSTQGHTPSDTTRVSIRKTFAERNAKFFFLCAKKQQIAQSFAKVISRKTALFRFCETQVLRNSAIS